jgi:hypothetical protein
MTGQRWKTFLPDGNRWLPNISENPLRVVWSTDTPIYLDPNPAINQRSSFLGPGSGEDFPDVAPAFKRTIRSRLMTGESNYVTLAEGQGDFRRLNVTNDFVLTFVGNKHAGYDAVKFSATIPDKRARGVAVYLEYDESFELPDPHDPWNVANAEDYVLWCLNRPFYFGNNTFSELPVAPLVNERNYFRCVVTDGDDNTAISDEAWLVYASSSLFTAFASRQHHEAQPSSFTVHAGEIASATFQKTDLSSHYGSGISGTTSYYRWRRRCTQSDPWEWMSETLMSKSSVSKVMPPDPVDPDASWSEQWQCVVSASSVITNPSGAYQGSVIITVTVLSASNSTPVGVTLDPGNCFLMQDARWAPLFAVAATGKNLTYQWQQRLGDGTNPGDFDWVNLEGATEPVLDLDRFSYPLRASRRIWVATWLITKIFKPYYRTFGDFWGDPEFTAWQQYFGPVGEWDTHTRYQILQPFTAVRYSLIGGAATGEGLFSHFTEGNGSSPVPDYAPWKYIVDTAYYYETWQPPVKGLWDDDTSYNGGMRVWQKPYDYGDTPGAWPPDPATSVVYWPLPASLTTTVSVLFASYGALLDRYSALEYNLSGDGEVPLSDDTTTDPEVVWSDYLSSEFNVPSFGLQAGKDKFRTASRPRIWYEIHPIAWRIYLAESDAYTLEKPLPGDMDHTIVGPDAYGSEPWGSDNGDIALSPYSLSTGPEYFLGGEVYANLSVVAQFSRRKDIPLPFAVPSNDGGIILGGAPLSFRY